MIARFRVQLPFTFLVQEGVFLSNFGNTVSGYEVVVRGPLQTRRKAPSAEIGATVPLVVLGEEIIPANPPRTLDGVSIDGQKAIQADLIQLDFRKADFNRQNVPGNSAGDPPEQLVFQIVNSLLRRLRSVSQAPRVFEISSLNARWSLEYISDNEESLPANTGLVSTRTSTNWRLEDQPITQEIWIRANGLPPDYQPARWDTLLLDAKQLVSQVGPALVLAATAVETAASAIIDYLFTKSTVPKLLQEWINDRGDWRKDPSVEEQCDVLLKSLSGRSLKDEPNLWEAFKNLKKARNQFVHEGVALINGKPANPEEAAILLDQAGAVISFLESFLDDSRKRPIAAKPAIRLPAYLER